MPKRKSHPPRCCLNCRFWRQVLGASAHYCRCKKSPHFQHRRQPRDCCGKHKPWQSGKYYVEDAS